MPYSVTTTIVKYKGYKNLTQGKLKKCLNKAQNDVNSGYFVFQTQEDCFGDTSD